MEDGRVGAGVARRSAPTTMDKAGQTLPLVNLEHNIGGKPLRLSAYWLMVCCSAAIEDLMPAATDMVRSSISSETQSL